MIYGLYALCAVLAAIFLLVILALLRPSAFRIARSLLITAPPEKLFPHINNLRKFQEWSPYRDKDPNAKNEFAGPEEGPESILRWAGNSNIGEGSMRIVENVVNDKVVVDLIFLKPFAGHNTVVFSLAKQGIGTEVTWAMTGRFAFMPRLMGLFISMDRMIGNDFAKGLERLKALVESGSLPSTK